VVTQSPGSFRWLRQPDARSKRYPQAIGRLLFSLITALSWRIKPLEALIPQMLAHLLYPLDKSNLDLCVPRI
jgi:hypothetical protein